MSPMLRAFVWRLRDAERRLANRVRRNPTGVFAKMAASQFFALTPDAVRRGLAVGLFWAMIPMPFQMAPAALFCWLARANLPLAVVCVWISNPLTYAPVFWLEFAVGQRLLDDASDFRHMPESWAEMFQIGGLTLLVGALACGIVMSLVGFALGGPLAAFLQNLRQRRILHLKKRRRLQRAQRTAATTAAAQRA